MPRPRKTQPVQPVQPVAPSVPQAAPMYAYAGATPVTQPAPQTQPVPQAQPQFPLSGLYVFGQVTDRTRRTIPTRDNSTAEIVTYTVEDNAGHRYFIDEYSPSEYNDIGAAVQIPVYVKTFKKRNGDVGYSFCVQQQLQVSSRGEHF